MSFRSQLRYMNPYEIHKALVNEYILNRPGATKLLKRDTSRDRTDADVIRENHKFLWEDDAPETWEAQFAKKYYDKLFKEYCIGDLSRYKDNKVALRWRTEQEVVIGKGQFICANKKCTEKEDLRTWEVNFAYMEQSEKKNALVKIRLCMSCSRKLNYRSKKREIKRLKKQKSGVEKKRKSKEDDEESDSDESSNEKPGPSNRVVEIPEDGETVEESPWDAVKPVETKSRDEEMEDYLEELLL